MHACLILSFITFTLFTYLLIWTQSQKLFEQVQALTYLEEESEIVKQNEKTLKSEIVLVRSKLANCETELLQCKNKIRKIMEDIHNEQRILTSRQHENR